MNTQPIAYELRFDTGAEIMKDVLANQAAELSPAAISKLYQNLTEKLLQESNERDARLAASQPSGRLPKNHYFYFSKTYEQYAAEKGSDALLFVDWYDRQRLEETDFLAWLADKNLSPAIDFNTTNPIDTPIPNPILFDGWMSLIWSPIDISYVFSDWSAPVYWNIDYIYNDKNWPILSRHMCRVLQGIKEFQHQVYPIEIHDYTLAHASTTDRTGRAVEGYAIVQTLENLDIFDWEKSQYIPHSSLSNQIQSATQVILKTPAAGLPPLFRLTAYPQKLFVSAAAQAVLEGDIRGARFTPIDENYRIY
jgi:hypothetical protein